MTGPNVVQIAKALDGKKEGRDWKCLCPIHGGHHFIITDKKGHFQMHCMAGAKYGELRAALSERGLWPSENGASPREPREPVSGNPAALYHYRDSEGVIVATKGRFLKGGKKTFAWSLDHGMTWGGLKGLSVHELPLYGGELLGSQEPVFYVEGEKAAEALRERGCAAVCAASGAGSKPSEASLSLLRGRRVVVWPDNDQQGRAYAYYIWNRLKAICDATILKDIPELPEKGDAHDFFVTGGGVDSLIQFTKQNIEPEIRKTAEGWRVSLPSEGGAIHFQFDNPTHGRHELTCEVTVWQEIAGQPQDEVQERLNLLSSSGKDSFRRSLNDLFERPKGFWTLQLNRAITMARKAISEYDPSIRLKDAPPIADEGYLLHPFIVNSGPTILFGDGGSGKSYIAIEWARHLCEKTAVLYIDYEATQEIVRQRAERLGGCPDGLYYWPTGGVPLPEMVPGLRQKIDRDGVGLVIVDSAIPACGAEPEKADTARAYFQALARLGVPSLTISHVTKAGEDRYPYGNVMWRNLPRSAWNVKAQEDERCQRIGLFHRKANDGRLARPRGLEIRFGDGVVIEEGPVPEFAESLSLSSQIRALLRSGQASVKELAEELDEPENKIRARLSAMGDARKLERADDGSFFWGLKA